MVVLKNICVEKEGNVVVTFLGMFCDRVILLIGVFLTMILG
jgi:hypothetical protein